MRSGFSRNQSFRVLSLLLGGVALAALFAGLYAGRVRGDQKTWLLKVDTADERTIARLADEGGRPVRLGPTYTLILANRQEESLPALQSLHPERLGPYNEGFLYYVVDLTRVSATVPPIESLARVLFRDGQSAVVEIPQSAEDLLTRRYSCARIFDHTLRLGLGLARGRQEAALPRTVTHDPEIQAMVDAVDIARLQEQTQHLQDFTERRSFDAGGVAAQEWLVDQFTAMGYTDVSTFSYNDWSDNVICKKAGAATPDRIYIVGGHYDSNSIEGDAPGADDNGSGTAAVLELARLMFSHEFQSTIYFTCWSGEEQGLVGSDAWAQWAASQGLDIRAYINLDMEGYVADAEDLDLISNFPSTWLHDLTFAVVPLYVPTLPVVDGHLTGASSDHASFWGEGYSAVFFFEDVDHHSPYIHTPNDVIGLSLNNFPFMKKNTQAALAVFSTLAQPFRIAIDHTPVADTPEIDQPVPVTARILAVAPLVPDSLRIRYRMNGGAFSWLPLTPTGNPNEYEAEIPAPHNFAVVEYYIRARDTAGHVATDPDGAPASLHRFAMGLEDFFVDDFENDQGWTVGAEGDNATAGIWLRADPVGTGYQPEDDHTPDPGHICFVTGNGVPGGPGSDQDVDGGRTSLTSPIFDLSGARYAQLSYWRWYVDETNPDDVFRVYVSNNGGTSWQVLEQLSSSMFPWTQAVFYDLGQIIPLTSQMRLRFVAEDVGASSLVEALLDDLRIGAYLPDPAAIGGPGGPDTRPGTGPDASLPGSTGSPGSLPHLLPPSPNPIRDQARFAFSLPAELPVSLSLHDASGRLVRSLASGTLAAGTHSIEWNGRDESGRPVAGGSYFLTLRAGGRSVEEKVTVMR